MNRAVTPALSAVSNKNTVQALDGLLLTANKNDGTFIICGYDLEKGVKVTVSGDRVQILKSGSIIVNAMKFSSIIRNLPDGNVFVSVDHNFSLNIACNDNEFTLHGFDSKIFPLMPELKGEKNFKLSRKILKNMIASVLFSVAANEMRPALNGVLFEIKNNRLNIVASDNNRLSLRRSFEGLISDTGTGEKFDLSFIIPGKSLAELLKLTDDEEEPAEIELTKKHVIVSFDNIIFFSRLIESEYPDYRRYMKIDAKTSVVINTQNFLDSVERSALLAEKANAQKIKLSLNKEVNIENQDELGSLQVTSASSLGQMCSRCGIEIYGEDLAIAFNQRYLSDALKAVIKEEKILMKFESPFKSLVLLPYEDGVDIENAKFVYLIVPVRTRD